MIKTIKRWTRKADRAKSRKSERAKQMSTVKELVEFANDRAKAGKRKCRTPNYKFMYKTK